MAVNATAVWRVRPGGGNTQGGGYDPGIAGAGTDYSQQNSSQASGVNLTGTTATVTDATANAFTTAMVGNAMYITAGGSTTGWYFVISRTSASTVVLDRSPGTITNASWTLGGAFADWWTNFNTTTNAGVPGNKVYVLGTAVPNPSSYHYDYVLSSSINGVVGNTSAGRYFFLNDPAAVGYKAPPDTTGTMPVTQINTTNAYQNAGFCNFAGMWFVCGAATTLFTNGIETSIFGCVHDQFGFDSQLTGNISWCSVVGCEVFSSVTAGVGTGYAVGGSGGANIIIDSCNIHDCISNGPILTSSSVVANCIIAKCGGDGLTVSLAGGSGVLIGMIKNNTIDGNGGNGILLSGAGGVSQYVITNNIITNHTTAAKAGISATVGTAAVNALVAQLIDYNVYYNNTSNYTNITAGPHDTALVVTPYLGSGLENYGLA